MHLGFSVSVSLWPSILQTHTYSYFMHSFTRSISNLQSPIFHFNIKPPSPLRFISGASTSYTFIILGLCLCFSWKRVDQPNSSVHTIPYHTCPPRYRNAISHYSGVVIHCLILSLDFSLLGIQYEQSASRQILLRLRLRLLLHTHFDGRYI